MNGSDLTTKYIYKTPTLVFFTPAHQNIVHVTIHPLTLSPVHGIENLEIIYNFDDMIIQLLHIVSPDLILKLYVFIPFFIRVISLTTRKMVPSLMERITNWSVIFSYFVDRPI